MTSIEDEMVGKMRRMIGDTDEPYAYTNSALVEYIEDAIDAIYLDWQHGYEVDRDNHTVSPDIRADIQMLFIMKAKLDMLDRRPDISFQVGSMDIRRKNEQQKRLANKVDKLVNKMVALDAVGGKLTEFDYFDDYFDGAYSDLAREWIEYED